VGSGPFETQYAEGIMKTRFSRLNETERAATDFLMGKLNSPAFEDKTETLARFGKLMSKADTFDPLSCEREDAVIEFQDDIYQSVWQEAVELRHNGGLLKLGSLIQCPVLAIHGDYDPHPAEGVEKPLSRVVKDFRFVLLKSCGHEPWNERAVNDDFYQIIKSELTNTGRL
jgi:pimeloyl-ACP methyl ester carboxylesterase